MVFSPSMNADHEVWKFVHADVALDVVLGLDVTELAKATAGTLRPSVATSAALVRIRVVRLLIGSPFIRTAATIESALCERVVKCLSNG